MNVVSKCVLILLIASAAFLCPGCLGPVASLAGPDAPIHYTTVTEDGWTLSLRRYQPARIDPNRPPVILCHGLSYNNMFWDLREDVSLARYLASQGYDVWAPSLRGAGWSTKPGYSRLRQLFRADLYGGAGGTLTSGGKGILKWNWSVDDHIQYDVPAILDAVCKYSGHESVHWVGHSMGGMIMLAHLASQDHGRDPRVNSVVALATPMMILPPLSQPMQLMADARRPIQLGNALVSTNLPALLGIITGNRLSTPIETLFYNARNVDAGIIRLLNTYATDDIAPGQFAQLLDMVSNEHFRSSDHSLNYTSELPNVQTPTFWIAGTVDNLATVGAVQLAYHQINSTEKQYRLFGRVNGQRADYGHNDLVIGRNARREVWPSLLDWLASEKPVPPGETLLPTDAAEPDLSLEAAGK